MHVTNKPSPYCTSIIGSFITGLFQNIQERTKALVFVFVLVDEQAISQKTVIFLLGRLKFWGKKPKKRRQFGTVASSSVARVERDFCLVSEDSLRDTRVITQHRENTNFIVFNRIERVIVAMPILLCPTFFRCCYITTFQKLSNPNPRMKQK